MELNNGIPRFGSVSFQKNIKLIFSDGKDKFGDEDKYLEGVAFLGDKVKEAYDPDEIEDEDAEEEDGEEDAGQGIQ